MGTGKGHDIDINVDVCFDNFDFFNDAINHHWNGNGAVGEKKSSKKGCNSIILCMLHLPNSSYSGSQWPSEWLVNGAITRRGHPILARFAKIIKIRT